MNDVLRRSVRTAAAVLVSAIPLSGHALDLTVQAGYQAEYTNNTSLTPTNEDSEWIQTPQVNVGLEHQGASLSATANYNFSRQIHQDSTFNDQNYTVGNAAVIWRAIADRLSFNLSNASTLTTIDSQLRNVPTNQQITNTTTAGTTLNLDGPSNHTINLHYDYQFSNAQDTDTDSRRQTATMGYAIPLNPQRRVQMNVTLGHVDYDSDQYSDYDSREADLEFANEGDTIELDTRIGYTTFIRDVQDDVKGMTGNFDIVWNVTDITHVNASFARSIQDQSANVLAGIPNYGQTFTDNSGITTPYTLDAYTLGIATQLGHNTISLAGHINNQNYDGSSAPGQTAQDQDTKGLTLGITRPVWTTLNAQLYANYSNTDFHDGDRQKNYASGIRFDWTRWRNLSISTATAYTKQTSDVATSEYTAWTGTITLMYTLIGNTRR